MIASIAQSGFTSPGGGTSLNTLQSESLSALLSNFDAKTLTEDDAKKIVSGIREMGIKAGSGLADALGSNGFSARDLADKAGVTGESKKGHKPPPPANDEKARPVQTDDTGINSEALNALTLLVEKYEGSDLSDDDWASLYTELEDEGIDVSKPLLDILL